MRPVAASAARYAHRARSAAAAAQGYAGRLYWPRQRERERVGGGTARARAASLRGVERRPAEEWQQEEQAATVGTAARHERHGAQPQEAPPPEEPRMERVSVTVPPMKMGGDVIQVEMEGQTFDVTVPRGVRSGQVFEVELPIQPPPSEQPQARTSYGGGADYGGANFVCCRADHHCRAGDIKPWRGADYGGANSYAAARTTTAAPATSSYGAARTTAAPTSVCCRADHHRCTGDIKLWRGADYGGANFPYAAARDHHRCTGDIKLWRSADYGGANFVCCRADHHRCTGDIKLWRGADYGGANFVCCRADHHRYRRRSPCGCGSSGGPADCHRHCLRKSPARHNRHFGGRLYGSEVPSGRRKPPTRPSGAGSASSRDGRHRTRGACNGRACAGVILLRGQRVTAHFYCEVS